jgi:hypothetical protein
MTQCSRLELAWAAGFFDGEGSASVCGTIVITIGQVNRENLFRFQRAVGIGIVSRAYNKGGKPISFYRAYSDAAFAVYRKLSPYLSQEKQDQFLKAAIRYCFRTVRNRKDNPQCRRGHRIELVGRYKDGDCSECRRLRRASLEMPPIVPPPTAFTLRLHGIREYTPEVQT